jgi:BirA family biotin operon repressor/biotin-[acetyl-CoA-carboxylase] ligase
VDRWLDLDRPPLREQDLRRALTEGPDAPWAALDVVGETGSTNADLAQRARDGAPDRSVLVAEHQSAGRGRRDRVWESPPRAGIAVSVLLRPAVPPSRWAWLGMLAALAVTDALRTDCGLDAVLKWPNDVLVDGRKIAGLLSVTAPPDGVVVGIGLNVSQTADELPVPTATSLRLAGSAVTDRDPVLRAVLRRLARRYDAWLAAGGSGVAPAYRERCDTIGRAVRVELPDGAVEGRADGVDDDGRLLVLPAGADRPLALSVGDVVHIRPAGTA